MPQVRPSPETHGGASCAPTSLLTSWLLLACLLAPGLGCSEDPTLVDGSVPPTDGSSGELGMIPDGGGHLRGVFTIIGCAKLDERTDTPICTGPAPLRLTFVPIGAGVDTFVWTFPGGDPASAKTITPSVLFAKPGTFMVGLAAGGSAGTTNSSGKVVVTPAGLGAPCTSSSECDTSSGLSCFCGGGNCPGGLSVGICSRTCTGGGCGTEELCVDLTRGFHPPADAGANDGGSATAWRETLCLPSCTLASDCRLGLSCRSLPTLRLGAAAGGSYDWRAGCFADALGDDGDSCFGPSGTPEDDRCLSGRCDPMGARGLCTSDCSGVNCPEQAACGSFNGDSLNHLCLRRCDTTHPCLDPLFDCQPAGQSGGFGFTIDPAEPPSATFCAPKRCSQPAECGPAGVCTPIGAASFCVRA